MITSLQNRQIKEVVKLGDSRERRKQNLFVIEGLRELSMAIACNYTVKTLFVCDELLNNESASMVCELDVQTEKVSANVFRKMAFREKSDGIIAVAESRHLYLDGVLFSANPFLIVIESIEKPGNLGAVLRTADAAGVDAVIVCDPKADIYNPNTIRSGIGCVFSMQVILCTSQEAFNWLKKTNITVFTAEPDASECYFDVDFTQPSAIVMGNEAAGLTDYWLRNADKRIKIPMAGHADSLNLSVSTAIITFEAMRQRKKIID